jgi:hypothetical protein
MILTLRERALAYGGTFFSLIEEASTAYTDFTDSALKNL